MAIALFWPPVLSKVSNFHIGPPNTGQVMNRLSLMADNNWAFRESESRLSVCFSLQSIFHLCACRNLKPPITMNIEPIQICVPAVGSSDVGAPSSSVLVDRSVDQGIGEAWNSTDAAFSHLPQAGASVSVTTNERRKDSPAEGRLIRQVKQSLGMETPKALNLEGDRSEGMEGSARVPLPSRTACEGPPTLPVHFHFTPADTSADEHQALKSKLAAAVDEPFFAQSRVRAPPPTPVLAPIPEHCAPPLSSLMSLPNDIWDYFFHPSSQRRYDDEILDVYSQCGASCSQLFRDCYACHLVSLRAYVCYQRGHSEGWTPRDELGLCGHGRLQYYCLVCMYLPPLFLSMYNSHTCCPCVRSQLNGNQGEVTNSDDMPPKRVTLVEKGGKLEAKKPSKKAAKRQARTAQLGRQKSVLEHYVKRDRKAKAFIGGRPIQGRGAYRKGKGKALGQSLGSHLGGKVGGWLGGIAEHLFQSVTGMGAYNALADKTEPVLANSLTGAAGGGIDQVPYMHRSDNLTRISHREYLSDIRMTSDYSVMSFALDPTNFITFPWLSGLAPNFQEYMFLGLVIEFRSLSAQAVSGTVAGQGSVTMSLVYDIEAPIPQSKTEIANAMKAVSGRPSDSLVAPMECAPQEQSLNTYKMRVPGVEVSDEHFYFPARLDIALQGAPNDYIGAGELWITYDAALLKPRANGVTTNLAMVIDVHYNDGSVNALSFVQPPVAQFDNIGCDVSGLALPDSGSSGRIVFPDALPTTNVYMVSVLGQGGSSSWGFTFGGVSGNLSLVDNYFATDNGTTAGYSNMTLPASSNTILGLNCTFFFRCNGPPATPGGNFISLPYVNAGTGIKRATVTVAAINPLVSRTFRTAPPTTALEQRLAQQRHARDTPSKMDAEEEDVAIEIGGTEKAVTAYCPQCGRRFIAGPRDDDVLQEWIGNHRRCKMPHVTMHRPCISEVAPPHVSVIALSSSTAVKCQICSMSAEYKLADLASLQTFYGVHQHARTALDLPASISAGRTVVTRRPAHDACSTLSGDHGEWTGTDDLPQVYQECKRSPCQPAHYHRKKQREGAEKRIAQKQAKAHEKNNSRRTTYVQCLFPFPDCGEPTHHHQLLTVTVAEGGPVVPAELADPAAEPEADEFSEVEDLSPDNPMPALVRERHAAFPLAVANSPVLIEPVPTESQVELPCTVCGVPGTSISLLHHVCSPICLRVAELPCPVSPSSGHNEPPPIQPPPGYRTCAHCTRAFDSQPFSSSSNPHPHCSAECLSARLAVIARRAIDTTLVSALLPQPRPSNRRIEERLLPPPLQPVLPPPLPVGVDSNCYICGTDTKDEPFCSNPCATRFDTFNSLLPAEWRPPRQLHEHRRCGVCQVAYWGPIDICVICLEDRIYLHTHHYQVPGRCVHRAFVEFQPGHRLAKRFALPGSVRVLLPYDNVGPMQERRCTQFALWGFDRCKEHIPFAEDPAPEADFCMDDLFPCCPDCERSHCICNAPQICPGCQLEKCMCWFSPTFSFTSVHTRHWKCHSCYQYFPDDAVSDYGFCIPCVNYWAWYDLCVDQDLVMRHCFECGVEIPPTLGSLCPQHRPRDFVPSPGNAYVRAMIKHLQSTPRSCPRCRNAFSPFAYDGPLCAEHLRVWHEGHDHVYAAMAAHIREYGHPTFHSFLERYMAENVNGAHPFHPPHGQVDERMLGPEWLGAFESLLWVPRDYPMNLRHRITLPKRHHWVPFTPPPAPPFAPALWPTVPQLATEARIVYLTVDMVRNYGLFDTVVSGVLAVVPFLKRIESVRLNPDADHTTREAFGYEENVNRSWGWGLTRNGVGSPTTIVYAQKRDGDLAILARFFAARAHCLIYVDLYRALHDREAELLGRRAIKKSEAGKISFVASYMDTLWSRITVDKTIDIQKYVAADKLITTWTVAHFAQQMLTIQLTMASAMPVGDKNDLPFLFRGRRLTWRSNATPINSPPLAVQ